MRTQRTRAEDGWRATASKIGVGLASAAIVGTASILLEHDRELTKLNDTIFWLMQYSGIVPK